MAEESFQEKTEQATPRRRQEARKQGNVAKSVDLNSVFVLLAGTLALYFARGPMWNRISEATKALWRGGCTATLTPAMMQIYLVGGLEVMAKIVAPVIIAVGVAGLAANYAQVGLIFALDPLAPKFSKVDPIAGAQRLVSKRALVELAKGIFKIGVVGLVAYWTIKGAFEEVFLLMDQSVGQIFVFIGRMTFRILLRTGLVLVILAALDYAFQRREHEQRLRMTKQEVKEEMKQVEGDPLVKSRVRSIQREMARRRMMDAVPKADVVITNPTHLAVALQYDPEQMAAPTVVAKGARLIAQRIREIAEAHGIPIVEDKALAQMLYKATEVGQEIPLHLYKAVAEILAYVYQMKGKSTV